MTLNKRYLRNIKNNFSFYICVCILTMIVVLMYLDFDAAANKAADDLDYFFDEYKVENAQFTTAEDISEEDIKRLEEKYDILMEKQKYIDFKINRSNESVDSDDDKVYEIRLLSTPKKINLYVWAEGDVRESEPQTEVDEGKIILNTGLAEGNSLNEGDVIKLGETKFRFAGDFERPDYLFPIKDTTDTFAMKNEFGIGLVSDADFEELMKQIKADDTVKEYYVIRYNKDNENEVRKSINEDYQMLSYLKADVNTRVNTPKTEMIQTTNLINIVILMLVIFIAIIISVVIGRRIKNDRRQIGVLIALGYRKSMLARHYAFYGIFSGLLGTVMGVILAVCVSDKLLRAIFSKIEPVPMSYNISLVDILIAILVPTAMYTFSVYRSAKKVMKTDVITMISGRSHGGGIAKLRLKKSHLKVKTKFKLRQIFGKPARSIIVISGLAFGGMLYAFCLTCIDSMDSYVNNTVDQIGTFNYEYFLKSPELGESEKGSAILGVSYEVKGRTDVMMLLGIDNPDLINFSDENGNSVEFEDDRFYITSMASLAFDKGIGDEITIVDPITMEEYTVKITDIVKNDSQAAIYCSRKNAVDVLDIDVEALNMMAGNEETLLPYNIIMSDVPVSIDSENLVKTITKQSLADQINEVKIGMEKLVGIINTFAIIICIVVVYMMVNVLITESTASVSMLKVLGYRNKEINSMVLSVYHFLVPIALIISFMLGYFGTMGVFKANISEYKTYLATCIYPISIVKLTVLLVASYVLSLILLRGKAGKVDLVESLKDNRE